MNNKEIRKKALHRLSYFWVEAELLFLITFGLISVFFTAAYVLILLFCPETGTIVFPLNIDMFWTAFKSNAAVKAVILILPVLMLISLSPLAFGVRWCYYQAAHGRNTPVSGAFFGYYSIRKWAKSVLLNLLIMLRKLVYLIPIGAVGGAVYYIFINILNSTENSLFKLLLYFGIVLVIIGLSLIYMILTVKFQLIPYLFAEDPEKGILEIYHNGIAAMKGSKGRFAALQVWFVPLLALCFTGYLAMFVIPFYCMVKAICAAEISGGKLFDEQTETDEQTNNRETSPSAV